MTINLSSKSGSGGTGSAIKDPRVLPLSMIGAPYIKSTYTTRPHSGESNFWTYYSKVGTSIVYTTNDTWQTVVDITNSHGNVYNLMGPLHHTTAYGSHHFRITVDGTEYLIEPSVYFRNCRLVAGISLPFIPEISNDNILPNEAGSYGDYGLFYYNSVIRYPLEISYGYIPDPHTAFMQGSPYLYFTESFKFEVKVSIVYDVDYYKNAGCMLDYTPNF